LSGGDKVRNLGGFLSRLGGHRQADGESHEAAPRHEAAEPGTVVPTKALGKFLSYLGGRPSPVLLDRGPAVGSNLAFFGEQLGCKVYIEDLFADLDRHLRQNALDKLSGYLTGRFTLEEGTVDGVLAWDLFDYLDRASARSLAAVLVKLMRNDAALLCFFGSTAAPASGYTKFVIEDATHLRHRHYASAAPRQRSLQNRDIIKMFEGLRVSDSFLLQNNVREILFRKGGAQRPVI
jgi:hypothetical protein